MTNIIKPCAMCDGEGIIPSKAYVVYRNVGKEWKKEFDKSYPLKTCDTCNGDGELFYIGGEKERFNILADRWEGETSFYSSIETNHPCFIEMNKMKSKKAIGWLLERMKKKTTWLMALLGEWVSKKDNSITKAMWGKVQKMTDVWIKWGIEKKLIKK